jgi:protein involved in polysaccharide export with SLBB domain
MHESPLPHPAPPAGDDKRAKAIEAAIDKMINSYDLKPHPEPPIPDNPPPHEGALIDLPYVVEPPDLILVEVLEALPGRPISGERLIRPDGAISLGFYGDVHVRGLTLEQVKVKIIKHLRKYLTDEVLGLFETTEFPDEEVEGPTPYENQKPSLPEPPESEKSPFPRDRGESQGEKPRGASSKERIPSPRRRVRSTSRTAGDRSSHVRPVRNAPARLVGAYQEEGKATGEKKAIEVPLDGRSRITITIDIQGQEKKAQQPEPTPPPEENLPKLTPPETTDRVFVDVTAYNSKKYFVQGDVAYPGVLPITGQDTVLDALQYAGGLLATAEPKDIRLVRPPRGGKPARVYKVDLEAIRDKGDVTSNYQLFPGDRLIVGRNDAVKKTIELDRLAAPLQTVISSILQEVFALRYIEIANAGKRDAILRDLVDFWIQEMKRPGGAKLDEQTLREALIRRLQIKPEKQPEKK